MVTTNVFNLGGILDVGIRRLGETMQFLGIRISLDETARARRPAIGRGAVVTTSSSRNTARL
jgi:hypothetical protein